MLCICGKVCNLSNKAIDSIPEPGVFFYTACYNIAAAGHTWQSCACAGHSMGLKGMLHASRAMALFGAKVMSDPELLAAAKKEFEENVAKDPYVCPFPENIKLPGQV